MNVWVKTSLIITIGLIFVYWVVNHSGYFPYGHNPMQYMPNMHRTPALKPQRGYSFYSDFSAARVPPEGTYARDVVYYEVPRTTLATEVERKPNPFPRTRAVVERGQEVYKNYCIVCHGPQGKGNGSVVPPHPLVPSLTTEKIRNYADSQIYHIATVGQNTMSGYYAQINNDDRWKLIHYIRVLQIAANPSADQVDQFENFGEEQ